MVDEIQKDPETLLYSVHVWATGWKCTHLPQYEIAYELLQAYKQGMRDGFKRGLKKAQDEIEPLFEPGGELDLNQEFDTECIESD